MEFWAETVAALYEPAALGYTSPRNRRELRMGATATAAGKPAPSGRLPPGLRE